MKPAPYVSYFLGPIPIGGNTVECPIISPMVKSLSLVLLGWAVVHL